MPTLAFNGIWETLFRSLLFYRCLKTFNVSANEFESNGPFQWKNEGKDGKIWDVSETQILKEADHCLLFLWGLILKDKQKAGVALWTNAYKAFIF